MKKVLSIAGRKWPGWAAPDYAVPDGEENTFHPVCLYFLFSENESNRILRPDDTGAKNWGL